MPGRIIDFSEKKFKKIINIPSNIKIEYLNGMYKISGPKGFINHKLNALLKINISNNILSIIVQECYLKKNKINKFLSILKTTYILFKNYITGVIHLFDKTLILKGVGYKAEYNNSILKMILGYSHPIIYLIPKDIEIKILTSNSICIKGVSKHKVGQIAQNIKQFRLPDAYKGNGIIYKNEIIKLKSPKKSK